MFEQDSYIQDMPATPTQEGDLFHKYEIKPWDFSPRIYKILGVSALVNVLFFAAFAQANFLTMRGCDSPFVGRVCTVLDMAYVGTVLFGTEREYIDVAYERTSLGDMDVTFISMDGAEPMFEYPPGYFQVANPEQFQTDQQNGFDMANSGFRNQYPGISSNPTINNDLSKQQQRLPKYNPKAVEGTIADPWGNDEGGEDNTVAQKDPKGKPASENSVNTNSNPDNPPITPTDPPKIEVNSRPYKDLGEMVNELLEGEAIKLNEQYAVRGRGKLTKDGKLDPKTFRFIETKVANPKMEPVLKRSFEAISESGHLKYLELLSGKDIEIDLRQNETHVTAVVQSEMESDNRAKSISSGLMSMLKIYAGRKAKAIANMEAENNPEKALELQDDKDDLELLKSIRVERDGKKIVIRFEIPQEAAQKMLERKLSELKEEAEQKPNSNAGMRPGSNTAVR